MIYITLYDIKILIIKRFSTHTHTHHIKIINYLIPYAYNNLKYKFLHC